MDLIIRGGTLLDGTGKPGLAGDLAVAEGRISAIGTYEAAPNARVLDASGCFVSPGFIDIHSHSDFTLLMDPRAVSSITQGVTTEIVGNCGHGCAPVRDPELVRSNIYGFDPNFGIRWTSMGGYLDCLTNAQPAVNVASLVPNGNLRLATAGALERASTADEVKQMQRLLRESLDEGAIGYSSGLEYGIERGCSEEEVHKLCEVAHHHGGFYATHTRNLDQEPQESIAEAIRAARKTGIPLQISHLSVVARLTRESRQAVEQALEQVDLALREGLDVSFDMHTRLFGTTNLSAMLPPWALEGGKAAIAKRLRDPSIRSEMRRHPNIVASLAGGDWTRIVIFDSKVLPEVSRKSIAEVAAERDNDPYEAIYDILLAEIDHLHELMILAHVYREEDIESAFLHPLCMVGSDATALAPDGPLAGKFFHGAYTWAGWFWRHFVQVKGILTPEEAVRRLTSLPAQRLGLKDRGVLKLGAAADVSVFQGAGFAERGTTFEPNRTASGVRHVLVNGSLALENGILTGLRSGQVLRGERPRWT
jgi:N-acyl-D-amino-acid deacylase